MFDRIVDKKLNIRRLYITATKVVREEDAPQDGAEQLDLFTNYEEETARRELFATESDKERKRQKAVLALREKYGKNAVLKATSLEDGATARERNNQIGGHKA